MNKLQQESEEILDKLSLDLKISLAKEFNRKIINKIEIFTKNFSNTTLDLLCFACVEEFYLPNQIIYSDNHKSEPSLIYVISGQIELVYLDQLDQSYSTQYINSQIKEGQICGQLELFTGMSQQRYFRSTEYCQILRITHKDFVELVRKDQKDFEKFCQIRDNVLVYESFSSLSVPCEICNYSTHQVFNCPMIHLQKNFMIQKIGISQKQQQNRQYQDRQQTHKTKKAVTENNPAHQQFIQEHLFQQQINSNNEIEYEFSEMTDQEQSEQENQTATQLTIDEQGKIFKIEEGQPVEMKNDKRKSVQIQQITIPMAKMQQGGYRQSILQQVEEIAQKGEDLSNIQDLKGMSKRKQSILSKKMEFNFDVQQISETVSKIRNSEGDCFQVLLSPSKKQSFIYLSNYQSQLNNSQDFEEKSNPSRRKERNKTRQFTRTGNSHLTQILKIQQMGNLNQNKQQEDELENPWNFEKLQDYKFYFTKGNSKNYLIRYNKFYNKKFKEILKKQFKK